MFLVRCLGEVGFLYLGLCVYIEVFFEWFYFNRFFGLLGGVRRKFFINVLGSCRGRVSFIIVFEFGWV